MSTAAQWAGAQPKARYAHKGVDAKLASLWASGQELNLVRPVMVIQLLTFVEDTLDINYINWIPYNYRGR